VVAAALLAAALDVLAYDVRLELRPSESALRGRETIRLARPTAGPVTFDAASLRIATVRSRGRELRFEQVGDELRVELPAGTRDLSVDYTAAAGPGLKIAAEGSWGAYHTWRWMVARKDPADRAELKLTVKAPKGWRTAVSARSPSPSYVFGFAAGPLAATDTNAGRVRLRVLAAPGTETRGVHETTAAMLAFFEEKAGVPFPHRTYTQAFLPGAPPQEMAGMALLSARYGAAFAADPKEDWLLAHELAHQWWGNLVTCADWNEFWLNEGVATFMAAAWKEHRFGRAAYDRELALARERLDRVRAEGKDRPLLLPPGTPESAAGGAVPYQRGFLFLDALRTALGEPAFWSGLRTYTRRHAPGPVTSADLRRAMEEASQRDLGALFDRWLGEPPAQP
jgi:aminopeptidase N